ncbi:MAG: hypothetical protein ABMB14_29820, partial [Myxococcota bacterium]
MSRFSPTLDLSLQARLVTPLAIGMFVAATILFLGLPWRMHVVAQAWAERRAVSVAMIAGEASKGGLDFGELAGEFVAGRLALLASSPDARFAVLRDA